MQGGRGGASGVWVAVWRWGATAGWGGAGRGKEYAAVEGFLPETNNQQWRGVVTMAV
jgi:hypothetical protein